MASCGEICRVKESTNAQKVIMGTLVESYGEIGRVPVNLRKITISSFHCYDHAFLCSCARLIQYCISKDLQFFQPDCRLQTHVRNHLPDCGESPPAYPTDEWSQHSLP